MNENEIIKAIYAMLGGDIKPIGDTDYDKYALMRAKKLVAIMKELHLKIDECACFDKSHYVSEKAVGKVCAKYLDWLDIED